MTDLRTTLGEAVGAAFAAEGVDPALARVTPSDRPDLADFQSNGALAAAKALKANPRELAGRVAERLAGDPRLASVGGGDAREAGVHAFGGEGGPDRLAQNSPEIGHFTGRGPGEPACPH